MTIDVRVATGREWDDVVNVLGDRGGYANCWCMFWRLTNGMMETSTPASRQQALQQRLDTDPPPGLLAYRDGVPIAWCQVAPRSQFLRLFRTRALTLAEPDDPAVWAVMCIYVVAAARGQGVGLELIEAAFDHAQRHGAGTVEGYPLIERPRSSHRSTGSLRMFLQAGFQLVEGGSGSWCVVRRDVPFRP